MRAQPEAGNWQPETRMEPGHRRRAQPEAGNWKSSSERKASKQESTTRNQSPSGSQASARKSCQKPEAGQLEVSGAGASRNLKPETENRKPESRLELVNRTRAPLENGNSKLRSEHSKSKPESETGKGIRAGAGQSHESSAENWELEIQKQTEQVQNMSKPESETGNQNPGWSEEIAREPLKTQTIT